jgi:hypothetical protein
MLIATETEFFARQLEISKEEENEKIEMEEKRKNRGFTQVYAKGWKRVRELAIVNPGAAGLYAMFAEHIDPTCGAVICDQQFIAEQMQVSTRTVRRWLDYLEEQKAIVRIPIAGRVCAYALDPHEVWKGYNTSKEYAAFITKTLINKDGEIKRKIIAMFGKNEEYNIDL